MQKLNFIYWSYFHPAIRLQKQRDLQAGRVCHLVETPTPTTKITSPIMKTRVLHSSLDLRKRKSRLHGRLGVAVRRFGCKALFFSQALRGAANRSAAKGLSSLLRRTGFLGKFRYNILAGTAAAVTARGLQRATDGPLALHWES